MKAKIKIDNGKIVRTFTAMLYSENKPVQKDDCTKFIAAASIIAEVETQQILDKDETKMTEDLDRAHNFKMNDSITELRLSKIRLEKEKNASMERFNMWMCAFIFETKLKFVYN